VLREIVLECFVYSSVLLNVLRGFWPVISRHVTYTDLCPFTTASNLSLRPEHTEKPFVWCIVHKKMQYTEILGHVVEQFCSVLWPLCLVGVVHCFAGSRTFVCLLLLFDSE